MADIEDIIGKTSKPKDEPERIEIDGMCRCFWPFEYGLYDKKNKKLTTFCTKGHESIVENWELYDG